jgi:putative nucleotidyltransferase with HDIG domain
MRLLGGPAHLVRRFFGSLSSRYPSPEDQEMVAGALTPEEADTFWRQATPDLAHAIAVARHVMAARPGRTDLARAALLHDIGKIKAGLGTVGRSVASILHILRLPLPRRMRLYADHAAIGARMLEDLVVEQAAIDFARHHRDGPPDGFDPDDWAALSDADHAS